MKIDIFAPPRRDLFRNHERYVFLFNLFLATACGGILLGVYAIMANPENAETLGDIAMGILACSSVPFFIVGEKLRARRPLNPRQEEEMKGLCSEYPEVKKFFDLVARSGRHITYAEFDACRDFAEEQKLRKLSERGTGRKSE